MDSQLPGEGACEDSEESSEPCVSQKKGRSKNFSIQEDMLLIAAWENVSLESVKGGDQKQTSYWSRMASYFDEQKSFVSERTPIALTNRWSTIRKSVSKFLGIYNQIKERNQSGIAENDKVRQAMEMYQSLEGSAFPFLHCWMELRNSQKFITNISNPKKRVRTSPNDSTHITGSSQTPMSVDWQQEDEERLERPMRRKDAEKTKGMTSEPRIEASNAFFADMREQLSISANKGREEYENMLKIEHEHLELKKIQMRINETREKREQQMYEASIMAIDITNMEPQLASFYRSLKAEILEKRGLCERR